MKVHIPTPLRSYTKLSVVEARGQTLGEMFADLERQFPGIRFRVVNEQDAIREHIKVFVDGKLVDGLATPVKSDADIRLIAAISGGSAPVRRTTRGAT